MTQGNMQDDKFVLCFSDITTLLRRNKKKILKWAFAFGALGIFFGLIKPIQYVSEGTFREKNNQSSGLMGGGSLMQILGQGLSGSSDNEASSLIKSRKLMKEVITEHQLQGTLVAKSDREGLFKTIKNNLVATLSFGKDKAPVLKDPCCPLKITFLDYPGEIYHMLMLDLSEDGHYEIMELDQPKKVLGVGQLGIPFQYGEMTFTLEQSDVHQPINAQSYYFDVKPVEMVTKEINSHLEIEPFKSDKSYFKIIYPHRDRQFASKLVNSIMEKFQHYLKQNHDKISFKQLDYLKKRREQLSSNLKDIMDQHATYLTDDLYGAGFIDSEKEIDFLVLNQHEYKDKLLANDLEIKRLENLNPGNMSYYDRFSSLEGDPSVINHILAEIRRFKQLRDSYEIEVQKRSLDHINNIQTSFEKQMNELNIVQKYSYELKALIANFQENRSPDPSSELLNDHRFLLKGWFDRLDNARINDSSNYKKIQENFRFYLSNLERLFGVHEHVLQERLTHQQNPAGEYQGITLEVSTDLYLLYSKQLIQLEGSIRQNLFFIHQIEDPDFEITSLSADLTDLVSRDMIKRANELVLNLRDSNNQSLREQERIKDELNLQRTFLAMHLQQMIQLMELNKELVDEKIHSLQHVSLGLIHQQISLLEKNLQDYIRSRLDSLQQERILIKQHLEVIHAELAAFPKKWVSEQLIKQEVDSNKRIVEEIAKMVESKNIAHNLEVIQSAPLDLAIPALNPTSPKIILWGIIGFLFGGFIGTGLVLGSTIRRGLSVSKDNLMEMGFHVSGNMTWPLYGKNKEVTPTNLNTLRRLQVYFDSFESFDKKAKAILL
ncbi:MAG: hypothetical protein Q8K60_04455, partial [Parachlamydiaceae bacterium]|nr:hypothetical protein [Parachlamydiaceae bacterium]